MKKRMIKLINDERTKSTLIAQKGCVATSTDRCNWPDNADCTTYAYDVCTKDHSGCSEGARDTCTEDHASCYGNGVIDSCGIDNEGCNVAGSLDFT